jgi:hypothetical protein
MELVSSSIVLRSTESELYYARALLKYSCGFFEEAVTDLDQAID